jgi:hypothetical protein
MKAWSPSSAPEPDDRLRACEFLVSATPVPRWYSTEADVQGWTAPPDFAAELTA